jgi:peptide/nickel transport system permease protein
MGMLGLALLIFFVGMALFATFIANKGATDPTITNGPALAPPSWKYPLGTNNDGISVLSLVIQGSSNSLLVGLVATVISMVLGTVVGIAAGYRTGWTDAVLMRITDLFLVLPWLALAIVLAAVIGQSLPVIIGIIGFTSWPGTARLVRAQVLSVKEHLYVERARALGASDWHVVTRHVLPNVMPVVFSNTILTVAIAILSESALSFLGLGDPFKITWGTIIDFAFEAGATSIGAWWWLLAPSICIVLVVLAFTLCGFAFDEIINPRLRQRQ